MDVLQDVVSKYINPKLVVAESHLTVTDATKIMLDSRINSVLVFEDEDVIGIVTNKDILVDLVAKGLDPTKVTIKEIMSAPLITIHENSTVKDAIDLMDKKDVRRLVVKNDERITGIVTRLKITGDLRNNIQHLPQLESPKSQ